jgi:hypothetical protein
MILKAKPKEIAWDWSFFTENEAEARGNPQQMRKHMNKSLLGASS